MGFSELSPAHSCRLELNWTAVASTESGVLRMPEYGQTPLNPSVKLVTNHQLYTVLFVWPDLPEDLPFSTSAKARYEMHLWQENHLMCYLIVVFTPCTIHDWEYNTKLLDHLLCKTHIHLQKHFSWILLLPCFATCFIVLSHHLSSYMVICFAMGYRKRRKWGILYGVLLNVVCFCAWYSSENT